MIAGFEMPKEQLLKSHVANLPEKQMLERVVLEKRKQVHLILFCTAQRRDS